MDLKNKVSVIHVTGPSAAPVLKSINLTHSKGILLPVSIDHSNPCANHARTKERKKGEALKAHCRAPLNTIRPKTYKKKAPCQALALPGSISPSFAGPSAWQGQGGK